jgi:hypothetical protein
MQLKGEIDQIAEALVKYKSNKNNANSLLGHSILSQKRETVLKGIDDQIKQTRLSKSDKAKSVADESYDSSNSSSSDNESFEEEFFSNLLYREEIDIIIDSFIKRIEQSKKGNTTSSDRKSVSKDSKSCTPTTNSSLESNDVNK